MDQELFMPLTPIEAKDAIAQGIEEGLDEKMFLPVVPPDPPVPAPLVFGSSIHKAVQLLTFLFPCVTLLTVLLC